MVGVVQGPPPKNEEDRLRSRNKWLETENRGLLENLRISNDRVAVLKAEATIKDLRIKELERKYESGN